MPRTRRKPILITPIKYPQKRKFDGDCDHNIKRIKSDEMITINDAEKALKETVPEEFQRCAIVYIILVKINDQYYIKIGVADRFFTTTNFLTKEQETHRYHSIIYGLRKHFDYVKIAHIFSFVKEFVTDEGELTTRDIESQLLKLTQEYSIDICGMKEYRENRPEILEIIEEFLKENNLEHFISKMV